MRKFISIFKTNTFKIVLLLGLFLTSVLIILAMLLGNESGNFVIQVESGDVEKSIAITDDPEDTVYTNRLIAKGMTGMTCTTPRYFLKGETYEQQSTTLKELTKDLGQTITEETVYIYTFYIINTGSGALNLELEMNISNVTNSFDKAIRVMTYNETQEEVHIYQAMDTEQKEYQYYSYTPEIFASDSKAFSQKAFISGGDNVGQERIKYSVLFWLEGQDPEGDERLFKGTIKFGLNIKVAS